jgi:hypothetical protein
MEVVDANWHQSISSNYFYGEQHKKMSIGLITHALLGTKSGHKSPLKKKLASNPHAIKLKLKISCCTHPG